MSLELYRLDGQGPLLEVSRRTAESVEFTTQGGGFLRSMPATTWAMRAQPAILAALTASYVFNDCDDEVFPCYVVPGYRWNGWAMPYFDAATAQRLAPLCGLTFDDDRDTFIANGPQWDIDPEFGPEEFPGHDITVDGKVVHVYGIGAGSWCWGDLDGLETRLFRATWDESYVQRAGQPNATEVHFSFFMDDLGYTGADRSAIAFLELNASTAFDMGGHTVTRIK